MVRSGGALRFRVLGPLEVRLDGEELPIATRRQRALLVLLLLNVGRVVPAERLVDQLWDGAPPPQAAVTLRSYVSNLRRALGGREGAAAALLTRGQGYSIDVPPETIDSVLLVRSAEQGREHLRNGRGHDALAAFDDAVDSWAGDPLAEVSDHESVRGVITQLTETYLGAVEGRFEALLAIGRHADAIAGLEAFVREHPLREEPQALLIRALYRAGRAPDALEVYRRFRDLLRDELGIDPSPRLDQLHQQVLEQDPSLAPAPPPSPVAPVAPARRAASRPSKQRSVVGRGRELGVLVGHLDDLRATGAGSLVLVAGEPGIGKTTLLDALRGEATERGIPTHVGRAPAAGGAPAFWTWAQVVDSVAEGLDDGALRRAVSGAARPVGQLSASVAERTGQAYAVTGDSPQLMRFLLYEAVSTFIGQATADQPVLITLDDIHWADVPSLELLSYLTPTLSSRPVMLVAAYRDLPAERTDALEATLATVSREDAVEELALAGLAPDDVGELMGDLDEGGPPTREEFVVLLHERTGGNPFFVRQLARLVLEAGGPGETTDAQLLTSAVPPGVGHVVARRLSGLSPGVEDFLAAAAVLGREFDLSTAGRVGGLDREAALEAFDEAVDHGLVESTDGLEGRPRFVHALVQEVVLGRLSPGRAAHLHSGAAAELEGQPGVGADELAEHLWAARDVVGAGGVDGHLAAARAAAEVFGHERAETHLRRALQLVRRASPPDPATELPVLLALFQLIATARGWGDADGKALADRAMELAGPAGCTDDNIRLWWSMFFFLIDRDDEAAYVQVASTLLRSLETSAGEAGHATWAATHLMNIFTALADDDRAAAHGHLRAARVHVEAASNHELALFDEHLHVMLLLIEGYWAALTGDPRGHREAVQRAVALADADGRPFPRAVARTLGAASSVYLRGDVGFVLDLAEQARDLDSRFGFGWLELLADSLRLWALAHLRGPEPDAARVLGERLVQVADQGRRGTESVLLLLLADVHALDGRSTEAEQCLLRVREGPGPYLGLVVDLVDERLRSAEGEPEPDDAGEQAEEQPRAER